jgi:hypothetical protein
MDKFSVYELLSFFIPGYISAKIVEYYFKLFEIKLPDVTTSNINDNILILVLAVFLGIIIHFLTFKLQKVSSLFQKAVYPKEISYINKNSVLLMILPAINEYYDKDRKHDDKSENIKFGSLLYYEYVFDFCYYYLEVQDKITQAKNFQSFYFLFRNLFTISLLHIGFLCILLIAGIFMPGLGIFNGNSFLFLFFLFALTAMIAYITRVLRGKVISKVLWSYYLDRRIKEIEKNKK